MRAVSALAAIFHRDGAPADEGAALRMLAAQGGRGPDAQRTWSAGEVALGHGLLATTPEDLAARQPFCAEGGSIAVVLDGRIDNRDEIADATGAALGTAPDVEVAAAAYAAWGAGFTERLLGDFAVIVWDARRRELVLGRDAVGARPLYYRDDRRTVRCASHPLALFAGTGDTPAPSFEAMALFLAERYVERTGTLIEGVHALAPGATLRIGATSSRLSAWSWPSVVRPVRLRSPAEYEERLRVTLHAAVRSRMRAQGPIAAHVSGGLDSSTVASIATHVAREGGTEPPVLLRCTFPGLSCDESAYSQAVADHLGLPITSVPMPGDLAAYAPDPERAPRLHLANPVSRMLVRMIEAGRERGIRVTLTGAGSDQLLQPTGFELADALVRRDARAALRWSGLAGAPLSLAPYRRIVRQLGWALPERARAAARALLGRRPWVPSWMTPAAALAARRAGPILDPALAEAFPRLPARRLVTQLAWDADYAYSLVLADGIAAACGAELRHPFFDRRVIELLLSFPAEERADSPPPKALLRRAMRGALPEAVRSRTSAAEFSPLVMAALVHPHGERLAELVRRGRLAQVGLVDPEAAAATVERARRGDVEVLREVVSMAALELWLIQLAPPSSSP